MSDPSVPARSFGLRLAALVVFLLPVGYGSMIVAVIAHEAVGHGRSALLLGGRLHGFQVRWDGLGEDLASSVRFDGGPVVPSRGPGHHDDPPRRPRMS